MKQNFSLILKWISIFALSFLISNEYSLAGKEVSINQTIETEIEEESKSDSYTSFSDQEFENVGNGNGNKLLFIINNNFSCFKNFSNKELTCNIVEMTSSHLSPLYLLNCSFIFYA